MILRLFSIFLRQKGGFIGFEGNYDDPSYGEEIRVLPKLRIDPKYIPKNYIYIPNLSYLKNDEATQTNSEPKKRSTEIQTNFPNNKPPPPDDNFSFDEQAQQLIQNPEFLHQLQDTISQIKNEETRELENQIHMNHIY